MPAQDAARGYPVRFRAVVLYYDPFLDPRRPILFVHDATGGIYVILHSPSDIHLHAGELIEVTGRSAPGQFAPVVGDGIVEAIGESRLPVAAQRVSFGQMLTGSFDSQWVEIEGLVHSVTEFGENVRLELAMSDGTISATTVKEPGANYSGLIDAVVRIRGAEAQRFNRNRQMTGVRLLFPSLSTLQIVDPPSGDPFALPPLPVHSLLRYDPNIGYRRKVHVRGPVTLQWPGRSVCIQNGADGLCAQSMQADPLVAGEIVELTGFPATGDFTPTLTDAVFRSAHVRTSVPAASITAEEAFRGDHDSQLVTIEGKLIGQDRAEKDPTVILSSGEFIFPVTLPGSFPTSVAANWKVGSTLRVTGICSVQTAETEVVRDGFSIPASFRILLRSPEDVVVVRRASWWTAAHLLLVLAVCLAITLCALGWVVALRQRISEQTTVIRKQNVILKGLTFQDGLTGVANRRKFDDTLEIEFARAMVSSTPISLLMIDIDHFKKLNDTYGHQSGDDCLIKVARALASASLRVSDVLARYGGEEFAVILPSCDQSGAVAAGERMRAAVFHLAIAHSSSPFQQRVSISVGAASLVPVPGTESRSLIALADSALYESKQQGRNRTTCALRELGGFAMATGSQVL